MAGGAATAAACSTCCTGSPTTRPPGCATPSIERYAAPLGLAVVMPAVQRSFYTDEAHGGRYWTFVSEELPGWSPRSSASRRRARTPSWPGCRWAATARSSWRSPSPSGTPRPPACRARSTWPLSRGRPGPRTRRSGSGCSARDRSPAGDDLFALLAAADRGDSVALCGLRHRGRADRVERRFVDGATGPGSTSGRPSAPANTSGVCGTRRSRTSSHGCRCEPVDDRSDPDSRRSDAGGGDDRVGEEAGEQAEQQAVGQQVDAPGPRGDAEQLGDDVEDRARRPGSGRRR